MYVPHSNKISTHVERIIRKMFAEARKKAGNFDGTGITIDEFDKLVVNTALPPAALHHIDLLGPNFFALQDTIFVRLEYEDAEIDATYHEDREIHLDSKRLIPSHWVRCSTFQYPSIKDPVLSGYLLARRRNIQRIEREMETMLINFAKLVQGTPSISQAVKQWPPLFELLPDYAQARLKREPSRKSRSSSSVDESTLTGLNTNLLVSKLLT